MRKTIVTMAGANGNIAVMQDLAIVVSDLARRTASTTAEPWHRRRGAAQAWKEAARPGR